MQLFPPSKIARKGFTLVELMVAVAVIGILAAIAIPTFLRYIRNSRTGEADTILRKMADGAKAYFTEEQTFSASANGDQPWHAPGALSAAPGLPVSFSQYVFPGGDVGLDTGQTACQHSGDLTTTNAPVGGSKQFPCNRTEPSFGTTEFAVLNKLRIKWAEPLYFKYVYVPSGQALDARAQFAAIADFQAGGEGHTVRTEAYPDENQEVTIRPTWIAHELQ